MRYSSPLLIRCIGAHPKNGLNTWKCCVEYSDWLKNGIAAIIISSQSTASILRHRVSSFFNYFKHFSNRRLKIEYLPVKNSKDPSSLDKRLNHLFFKNKYRNNPVLQSNGNCAALMRYLELTQTNRTRTFFRLKKNSNKKKSV